MIDMNVMTRDTVNLAFANHADFREVIKEVDKASEWKDYPLNKVVFSAATGVNASELYRGDETALEDTVVHDFPLVAELDGKPVCMRAYLAKQVRQHHKDEASILGVMADQHDWDAYAAHINAGRRFFKDDDVVQTMIRFGKVTGYFKQFNSAWNQTMQLDVLEGEFAKAFPNWGFASGKYQHEFTEAVYSLDSSIEDAKFENDTVMAAYVNAWEQAGIEYNIRTAKPMVRFATGESGLTSIALTTFVLFPDGTKFYLGPSLSVKHRGNFDTVWGQFDGFTKQIAVMFQNGLKSIDSLCNLTVRFPYNAMTHALKNFRGLVSVASLEKLAEDFRVFFDPNDKTQTCKAIDIYIAITELVNEVAEKQSPVRRLQTTETLGRLLVLDWSKFDQSKAFRLRSCKDDNAQVGEDPFDKK